MSKTAKNRTGLWVVVGIVLVVGVFFATFLGSGLGGGADFEIPAFGTPEVTGAVLPRMDPDVAGVQEMDPAQGHAAPEVRGQNYRGETVELLNDGQPKVVVFVAHWCGFCQQEVPALVDRLGGATVTDGVAWYMVATASNSTRPNFPPADWLEEESWPAPVIMDDVNSSVLDAYGVGSFPGWAVIGSDGTILARATGRLPAELVDSLLALAAGS